MFITILVITLIICITVVARGPSHDQGPIVLGAAQTQGPDLQKMQSK